MTPKWLYWPAASGTPWEPDQLGSLVGWWKADSITGLSDGDAVLVWPDSSGDGRDAADVNAPVYRVSTANGLPGVEFNDASSHNMTVSNTAGVFNDISGGTIAAVRKWGKTPASFAYEVLITTTGSTFNQRFGTLCYSNGRSATGPRRLDTDSAVWISNGSLVNTGSTDIQISVANFLSASVDMYRNGTADGGSASWQASGNTSATDPGIIRIGSRTDSANTFHGVMNEIVITNNALGAPYRQKLEGYLAHKWGLAGNLPIGHPYENAAP